MTDIHVAHLRLQGTDFILVPLSSGMARLTTVDQTAVISELRSLARSAGLGGDIVPVWQGASGMSYLADPRHHSTLSKTLRLDVVKEHLNRKISATGISATLARALQEGGAANAEPARATSPPATSRPSPTASVENRRSLPDVHAAARRSTPNRVVTMLFSDIVGSTKLKQQWGDAQAMEILKRHHSLIRQLLDTTITGEEVSTSGDSFFIAFATPSEAVTFALRWQDKVREFARDENIDLQDRIGIHVGEVYADNAKVAGKDFDLNGIQVDTAARIMSLAQGNQILMSQFAFVNAKQILEGLDFEGIGTLAWRAYGPYQVKGVEMPIEIYEVGEAGLACLKAPPDSEKAKRHFR
jgi:class 3 adenylate cyclase